MQKFAIRSNSKNLPNVYHAEVLTTINSCSKMTQNIKQWAFSRTCFKTIWTTGVRRKFSWVGFVEWHMVVIGIWCALFVTSQLTSYSCFQTNLLAKFVDIICIFFYIHSPYFMCHCTEYKLLALQVRISEENALNATTQQFITAKISGCALKQGSKTYSPLHQTNLQRKNETAL